MEALGMKQQMYLVLGTVLGQEEGWGAYLLLILQVNMTQEQGKVWAVGEEEAEASYLLSTQVEEGYTLEDIEAYKQAFGTQLGKQGHNQVEEYTCWVLAEYTMNQINSQCQEVEALFLEARQILKKRSTLLYELYILFSQSINKYFRKIKNSFLY